MYAVIRVRGHIHVDQDVEDTLRMMRLNRANHCVLLPQSESAKGMLQKVKDYVTWGEVDAPTLTKLLASRGKLLGNRPLTDDHLRSKTTYRTISELVDAMLKGVATYSALKEIKPVLRLHPPLKGWGGLKTPHKLGGALGYRGGEINELIERMITPDAIKKVEEEKVEEKPRIAKEEKKLREMKEEKKIKARKEKRKPKKEAEEEEKEKAERVKEKKKAEKTEKKRKNTA